MKLGVFGGTFNPIHMGHLRSAEEVREKLGLDKVIFVPARLPPHKTCENLADPDFRLRLVRLAVAGNPAFEVSDLELTREGPSYSADTLRQIRAAENPDELWFIMGADQYRELHTWFNFREILQTADLAVMLRPPFEAPQEPGQFMAGEFKPAAEGFIHQSGRRTMMIKVTPLAVSSTQVREALAKGDTIRYLVPEVVRDELLKKQDRARTEVK